jgi:tRNA (guanine-N7-)-methyltransferase
MEARASLQETHGLEFRQELIDIPALFPDCDKFFIEIGFGMGEATAIIAKNHPTNAYIAVDVHPPGVGKLLARIVENELTNLKVIEEDIHVVLQHMIPDNSLDGIHLFFPDPWPKTKHYKRRIVKTGFLELIHPKMKPGAYIHVATDWVPYARDIQAVFRSSPLFIGGVVDKPEWRPVTKFEGQGIDKDHAVNDMLYTKVES